MPLIDLICRAAKNHSPSYNFLFSARRAGPLVLFQDPPLTRQECITSHSPAQQNKIPGTAQARFNSIVPITYPRQEVSENRSSQHITKD